MSRIFQDRGFRFHLILYFAVNLLLIVLNLVLSPNKLWFYWPLLGWGIGVAMHGFGVYRRGERSTVGRETPRRVSRP
jgi:hypothetical protein